MMKTQRVIVLGQGYVGLPLAMRAAEVGCNVVGFDVDEGRVAHLSQGCSYVEDISDETVSEALVSGRYRPTSDPAALRGFDIAVISVPTPLREGAPDLSYVEAAGKLVASHLTLGGLVILESTTYPGTTEEVLVPLLEEGSGLKAGIDFHVGFSPERIDPGNARFGLVNTPKVIAGITAASRDAVEDFYSRLVDTTVPVSGPKEAELSKLLENTFRHVNIALVNELAVLAHELGIDVWEAIDAASTKPFGFMRFEPGPGVGGHCLPIDPSYLSWQVQRALGESFRFIELARDVNRKMPAYVVRRLMLGLNDRGKAVKGSRILLLGLAYKKNTGDLRESPAVEVAQLLVSLGANVVAADPHVPPSRVPQGLEQVELTAGEVARADAVVLLVDHDAFDLSFATAGLYVFDARRRLHGDDVERL